MNLEVAFERFRVFGDMGELCRCMQCVENFHQTMHNAHRDYNSAKSFLLKLCAAYIACFVKGEWQNAMELALIAHRDYLSGQISYDITAVYHLLLEFSRVNGLIQGRLRLNFITTRFG